MLVVISPNIDKRSPYDGRVNMPSSLKINSHIAMQAIDVIAQREKDP